MNRVHEWSDLKGNKLTYLFSSGNPLIYMFNSRFINVTILYINELYA